MKEILAKYDGKVQLVVRYAAFHGNSKTVIRALEATKKQDKYWQSLERLFATQPQWGSHHNPQVDLIYQFLNSIDVDIAKLKNDMKDPALNKIIEQDSADLKALGVRGTPTFFVNGKTPSEYNFGALQELLAQEVGKAYPLE